MNVLQGTEVIKTEDQDYTDFTKCLQTSKDKLKDKQVLYYRRFYCLTHSAPILPYGVGKNMS